MIKLKSGRTAAFDCDETLLAWTFKSDESDIIQLTNEQGQGRKFKPNRHIIDFLKSLKVQGYTIIVWSAASGNWASRVVEALQLEDYVDLTCDKLELAVDDLLDAKRIIKTVLWIDPITGEFKRNE